jgi:hypothetical protein
MAEDVRLTLSTRTAWSKFVPAALDSEKTTSEMIKLGAAEFLRYRGVLTVEVIVQSATGSRLMVWRGSEEVAPI